jgi:CubicO group peptidase (beta-lactamase class C family)
MESISQSICMCDRNASRWERKMSRTRFVVLGLALVIISSAVNAQDLPVNQEWHDAVVKMAGYQGPGLVVLVAKGDKVIYREALGMANIELAVSMKVDDTFRIASITKMFTAATIIKWAEQKKLSLDDPLAVYLPDFPCGGNITLRQLLNHTAGVSDKVYDPQPGFSQTEASTLALVTQISKRPPAFEPGTKWAYSNAGYILLGAVIEKISGRRWYEVIRSEFLEPLHLNHTSYGTVDDLIPRRASGYSVDPETQAVKNARYISSSIPAAAGGLISTAQDLVTWMRALSHGQALSPAGFDQMTTPVPQISGETNGADYGMGLYLWHVRGRDMIGHTGQINGFASAVSYLKDADVTIVVLANSDNFDARSALRRLAAFALNQPYESAPAAKFTLEELAALTGKYRAENGTERTLSIKDGQLFSQRNQGHIVPMELGLDGHLRFVPDEISYMTIVRNNGDITGVDYFANGDGPAQRFCRVTENQNN